MPTRFFPNYDKNKITSRFGMRTMNGTTRMHNGIDLVAETTKGGSATDKIKAHTGGTVDSVGYSSSAGYYINIKTDPNTLMVYYHLKELPALEKGATVQTGQIIGHMGSTGNSTGAHLHFGIKSFGSWVDPEPYLDADFTAAPKTDLTIGLRTLRQGATGEDVRALQILLTGREVPTDADGKFGPITESSVVAYQGESGLDPDGIVGRLTWSKLLGVSV